MRLRFKEGVWLHPLHLRPEVMKLLRWGMATAPPLFEDELWVTSGADGKHSVDPVSGHYVGCAFDVRCFGHRPGGIRPYDFHPDMDETAFRNGQEFMAKQWAQEWQRAMAAPHYLVIAEIAKDHIHAQWGRAAGG